MSGGETPWDDEFTDTQKEWLKIFSISNLIIYGLTFLIVLDTMRVHEIFKL